MIMLLPKKSFYSMWPSAPVNGAIIIHTLPLSQCINAAVHPTVYPVYQTIASGIKQLHSR